MAVASNVSHNILRAALKALKDRKESLVQEIVRRKRDLQPYEAELEDVKTRIAGILEDIEDA